MFLGFESGREDDTLAIRFDPRFLAIAEYGIAHAIGFGEVTYFERRTIEDATKDTLVDHSICS